MSRSQKQVISALEKVNVHRIYRKVIRPFLPTRVRKLAGIRTAKSRKAGDNLLPFEWSFGLKDQPEYEQKLIEAIDRYVAPGDQVVSIGGGEGIVLIHTARRIAPTGSVLCYEGSLEQVSLITENLRLNEIKNAVVHHGVVGSPIAVYGDSSGVGSIVAPNRLPQCDVLEMDCEGAEVEILQGLQTRPRVIVVETHGIYGATVKVVTDLLSAKGYEVVDLGYAEPRLLSECIRMEIKVLVGLQKGRESATTIV